MQRRQFLASFAAAAAPLSQVKQPLAITMWDFSWLERRWPGAGYEDWDVALNELKNRGYDAVRIDAYPHLVAAAPDKTWDILPCWNQQVWGAPARCRVQVQPQLNTFLGKCADRGMKVGLSTWWREDPGNVRMSIKSPQDLGRVWKTTLDSIPPKLRGNLLYVDLSNEFPIEPWTPFIPKGFRRATPEGERWMREAIEVCKAAHPGIPYTFSFTSEYDTWQRQDVSMLDFLELHIWMTHHGDFYKKVGYNYELWDSKGYDNLQLKGRATYEADPAHWISCLNYTIDLAAEWSKASGKPLMTTECWGVVDYKDWPLLEWDWVKELCAHGVTRAASTGRWVAMGTSNFCGPQFNGMWRDVAWHRNLTGVIHRAPVKV